MNLPADEKIRVLVVEDNPDDQELLIRQLRKAKLDEYVLCLSDPRQAIELLDGPKCRDLVAIFLDVHLPSMSGIELLELIRKRAQFEELPIIVMTSAPHPDTVAACKRLRVSAFVEKPVSFSCFSHALANLFHAIRPELTAS